MLLHILDGCGDGRAGRVRIRRSPGERRDTSKRRLGCWWYGRTRTFAEVRKRHGGKKEDPSAPPKKISFKFSLKPRSNCASSKQTPNEKQRKEPPANDGPQWKRSDKGRQASSPRNGVRRGTDGEDAIRQPIYEGFSHLNPLNPPKHLSGIC